MWFAALVLVALPGGQVWQITDLPAQGYATREECVAGTGAWMKGTLPGHDVRVGVECKEAT